MRKSCKSVVKSEGRVMRKWLFVVASTLFLCGEYVSANAGIQLAKHSAAESETVAELSVVGPNATEQYLPGRQYLYLLTGVRGDEERQRRLEMFAKKACNFFDAKASDEEVVGQFVFLTEISKKRIKSPRQLVEALDYELMRGLLADLHLDPNGQYMVFSRVPLKEWRHSRSSTKVYPDSWLVDGFRPDKFQDYMEAAWKALQSGETFNRGWAEATLDMLLDLEQILPGAPARGGPIADLDALCR